MQEINKKIKHLPKFLENELKATLDYLNYYRLEKLWNNIREFIEFLKQQVENYNKEIIYYIKSI